MSNHNLDNIPNEHIKLPVRMPNTDKDIILIDNDKKYRKEPK
jgi:hypothetical protein